MAQIEIIHPSDWETIKSDFFVAQGVSDNLLDGRKVVGILIEASSGKIAFVAGCYPQCPCCGWAIPFYGVPKGEYYLLVFEPKCLIFSDLVDFKVDPKFGLGITWPTAGSQVCSSNFVPYGSATANEAPVSGIMDHGASINGNTVHQPTASAPGWAVQFNNLPLGAGYTLKVDGQVTHGQQVANLTVIAC